MIKVYMIVQNGSKEMRDYRLEFEELLNNGWKINRVDIVDHNLIYILEK